MNDKVGQKRMFTLDVANEVYASLAAKRTHQQALIESNNTVASVTAVDIKTK